MASKSLKVASNIAGHQCLLTTLYLSVHMTCISPIVLCHLTASDFTMYPFATQNAKDFENLLSVYLDAAFFPQLREQDFRLVCRHLRKTLINQVLQKC